MSKGDRMLELFQVYNDALLVNEHVRPSDARDFMEKNLFAEPPVNETERHVKELYESSGQ